MKLRDIAKKIDKSKKNQDEVDISNISEELDINFYGWIEQDRLVCYWIGNWYCTDSWVGYRMYFLDDEPVAVSTQNGRKSDEQFEWFGKETACKVRDYILSIIPKEELSIKLCSLDDDIGDSYKISFNTQVLDWSRAKYEGEPIEFIERIRENPDYGIDQKSRVKLSSGEEIIVDIKDLDFAFCLKKDGE